MSVTINLFLLRALIHLASSEDYGAILRYYREGRGWSAQVLADLYTEELHKVGLDINRRITDSWITKMERDNGVPADPRRRWILASLLDIPPLLFGLSTEDRLSLFSSQERVDLQEYRTALQEYCQGWHSRSLFQAASDIQQRIDRLHHDIDYYRSDPAQKEKRALLCGYYLVFGSIALDQTDFAKAIALYNHAIEIAEQEQFYDLWCYALRQRGWTYRSRGEIIALIQGDAVARLDFQQAGLNYEQAQRIATKNVPDVYTGSVYGPVSQNIDEALKIVDTGSKQIGKQLNRSRIPLAAILNEERYHLDRAYTYLCHPVSSAYHAKMARVELRQAHEKGIHSLSRGTFSAVLLAKSYLIEGRYGLAAYHVREAINTVQASGSALGLARLAAIYRALRNSEYGESDDVATLGVDLLKAQQPTLFK